MYGPEVRRQARARIECGQSLRSISQSMGISQSALREWWSHPEKTGEHAVCPRCCSPPALPEPIHAYAYLLGLYLGDGCISVSGNPAKKIWALRIMCADAWPGLVTECAAAILAIRPDNKIGMVPKDGCTEVKASSRHWPCLFPQHGAGRKHDRKIELADWQREIVSEHPGALARGLFHSDGSRFTNRVRYQAADEERWYEYPRYMFTNESKDILAICGEALDRLGVSWRYSRRNTISVARREAVARLDEFVGPKY
jgi:hypothetical protein